MIELDRMPPADLDAERCLLGSVLLEHRRMDDVVGIIQPDQFYDEFHSSVFASMLELHNSGKRASDVKLIARKLTGDRIPQRLKECLDLAATSAHAVYYARLVQESYLRRYLLQVAADTSADASSLEDVEQAVENLERRATEVATRRLREGGPKDPALVTMDALDRLERRTRGEEKTVPTGFAELDEGLARGFRPGELIILAARTSMGKTALGVDMALESALNKKLRVLFVSLEMSAIELADRAMSGLAQVELHKMRNGTLTSDDRGKLVEAGAKIAASQLLIDDSPTLSASQIVSEGRTLKRKGGLDLVVVDYLQLIEPERSSLKANRYEQVGQVVRRLKVAAGELEVPVLCLAQLSRQAEDKAPRLSHLRESGNIEQDANTVIFIHGTDNDTTQDEWSRDIIVAKNRNGPQGTIQLKFIRKFGKFKTTDETWQEKRFTEFDDFNDRREAF